MTSAAEFSTRLIQATWQGTMYLSDGRSQARPTSIKERVDSLSRRRSRTEDLKAARTGSVAGSAASAGLEESHWLCPIEDQPAAARSPRRGRDALE